MASQTWLSVVAVRWMAWSIAILGTQILLLREADLYAQVVDERFEDWPLDLKVAGTLVVADEDRLSLDHLRDLLGDTSDQTLRIVSESTWPASSLDAFKEAFASVSSSSESERLDQTSADAIAWYVHGIEDTTTMQRVARIEPQFRAHLQSGKTLIVLGKDRKIVSRQFIATVDNDHPSTCAGLNLLPDCVLETDLSQVSSRRPQILSVLALHPQCVGIGIQEKTSLVLKGRKIRIVGDGLAAFLVSANDHQAIHSQILSPQRSRQQSPSEWMIDLTQWRRVAIDRTLAPFPPNEPPLPLVKNGTLMIVGGGGLPDGLMQDFIESAGGLENAKLVYIPCSEDETVPENSGMVFAWRKMGIQHASQLHTKDRRIAHHNEEFLKPLREATGIWFGGGRQWNFSDSYYGTTAHRLMKDVLRRGGVIGGSSAGASIQAKYLARATPIENFQIMAPGYERGGLGFIDGVAIDQHFTQRRRQADMTQLVDRYPQLLGIGIDESTAIVVKKSIATVRGKGHVYFYDRQQKSNLDRPDYIRLNEGQAFDLSRRQVVESP
jgi:cyanophycinase